VGRGRFPVNQSGFRLAMTKEEFPIAILIVSTDDVFFVIGVKDTVASIKDAISCDFDDLKKPQSTVQGAGLGMVSEIDSHGITPRNETRPVGRKFQYQD
jgi:hypothetical protein